MSSHQHLCGGSLRARSREQPMSVHAECRAAPAQVPSRPLSSPAIRISTPSEGETQFRARRPLRARRNCSSLLFGAPPALG
jgi:hypothetical protein